MDLPPASVPASAARECRLGRMGRCMSYACRAEPYLDLKKQFYGMREFAVADPDGRVITFAEPYQE
jgi:hypothetical protein